MQPINAPSHWLHGPEAARVHDVDLAHTGIGYATNHAACLFWALPFEWWLSARPKLTIGAALTGATAVCGVAAAVDYAMIPCRLRPGWEHAVSPRSIAATFGAMAVGLAIGGLLAQALHRR